MKRKQLSNFIIEEWRKKRNVECAMFFALWSAFTCLSGILIFLNKPIAAAYILFAVGGFMYISGWYLMTMDFWQFRKLSWGDKHNPETRADIIYE